MSRRSFTKVICADFDRIDVVSYGDTEWLTLEINVGVGVKKIQITLRSDEAVRDLHYALGAYLAHIERETK